MSDIKIDKTLLDQLDDEFIVPAKTKNKLTEDDVFDIRKLLAADVPQIEIAERYNVDKSTISSIKIGKTWRQVAEETLFNEPVNLFNEPLIPLGQYIHNHSDLPTMGINFNDNIPVIIGQDIIRIRALTGKAEKQAKEALRGATIEMLESISADCFFVRGNVASSKNSKEIGFYLKPNPQTGKNERMNILVDSKVTKAYKKDTAGSWLQNKVAFLNQVRHLQLPVSIEFTFIRDSMRRFDFINACQVIADLMVENGYFPDDDSVHFVPVFNKVVYYHPEMAGVIFRVL